MGHGPQLIPDWTLFIQMGLFFVSFLVLKFLVFKPYSELLHLRHSKTVGLREKAAESKARAQQIQQEYEAFIQGERKKTSAWTEAERRKIADTERDILQQARDRAAQELQAVRKKTEDELREAQRALAPLSVEFSSSIASKLLGYKVKVPAKISESDKGAETETVFSG